MKQVMIFDLSKFYSDIDYEIIKNKLMIRFNDPDFVNFITDVIERTEKR